MSLLGFAINCKSIDMLEMLSSQIKSMNIIKPYQIHAIFPTSRKLNHSHSIRWLQLGQLCREADQEDDSRLYSSTNAMLFLRLGARLGHTT